MTNRERAIELWRGTMRHEDNWRPKPEEWPEEWQPIEAGLDAAERRGWIAALEWSLRDDGGFEAVEAKLAKLKAEEAKR